VSFEKNNPITTLMTDTATGDIRTDILNEKVMSAIIEIKVQILFVLWVAFFLSIHDSNSGLWTLCLTAGSFLWSFIVVCYATFQSCILSRPAIVEAFDSPVNESDKLEVKVPDAQDDRG